MIAAAFTLCLIAPPAAASDTRDDTKARAEVSFEAGLRAARRGAWPEAVRAYQRSLESYFTPKTLYSLGAAQSAAGDDVGAYRNMTRFLALPAEDGLSRFRDAATAEQSRLRARIGVLRITAPEQGVVSVNGEAVGTEFDTDRPDRHRNLIVPVAPGPQAVSWRDEGDGQTAAVDVTVAAGATEVVRLRPLVDGDPDEDASKSWSTQAWLGWGFVGLGGVMGIAALGTGVTALGASDGAVAGSSEAEDARSLGMATDVLLFGGLGVAAAGGVLIALNPWDETEREDALTIGPSRVTLRF
ncbi:MAG: hypothetical protein AAGN82_28875 [Myxococcota bacterium]